MTERNSGSLQLHCDAAAVAFDAAVVGQTFCLGILGLDLMSSFLLEYDIFRHLFCVNFFFNFFYKRKIPFSNRNPNKHKGLLC